MIDQASAAKVTGSTFVTALYSTEILRLDGEQLTKPALAARGIVNFSAAKRLGEYLAAHRIRTAAQLYRYSPFDLARVRLHGPALLWTAMLLLESKGLDPMQWWGDLPTVYSVKQQPEPKKRAGSRAPRRARNGAR